MPPPSDEVCAAESAELLQDLEAFIDAEEQVRDVEPVAFEVSFGRPLHDEAEALARPEPASIPLDGGRRIFVAGRIDRVDRVGRPADHSYQVVDYKTDASGATTRRRSCADGCFSTL
jgi:ATP-dependent helicase/DNAse subunit B